MIDRDAAFHARAVRRLAALAACPTRLDILRLVRAGPPAGAAELAATLGLDRTLVVKHLGTLARAELVTSQRRGAGLAFSPGPLLLDGSRAAPPRANSDPPSAPRGAITLLDPSGVLLELVMPGAGGPALVAASLAELATAEARATLFLAACSGPPAHAGGLAGALGLPRGTASHHLGGLARAGLLVVVTAPGGHAYAPGPRCVVARAETAGQPAASIGVSCERGASWSLRVPAIPDPARRHSGGPRDHAAPDSDLEGARRADPGGPAPHGVMIPSRPAAAALAPPGGAS